MKTLTLTAPENFEFIPGDTIPRKLKPKEYGFVPGSPHVVYISDEEDARTYREYIPLIRREKIKECSLNIKTSDIYGDNIIIPEGFTQGDFDSLSNLQIKGYKYYLTMTGYIDNLHFNFHDVFRIGLHKE